LTNIEELPKPTALLFDMDGVLIDSEHFHKKAKEEAFRQVGIELSDPIYDSYAGRPDTAMIHD
jgi:beta-phosphoglucomutase-like phosphatase (HAD superfamily)